jgi:hypothetical protein
MEKYDVWQRMAVNEQALLALYRMWAQGAGGRIHGGIIQQGTTHRHEFTPL